MSSKLCFQHTGETVVNLYKAWNDFRYTSETNKLQLFTTVTTKSLRPLIKIIRFLGIASYCIIRSLRIHHTYCFSSVTSLNDLFSTQVNRVDIFSGFLLNFLNFKNCENGSKKVTK